MDKFIDSLPAHFSVLKLYKVCETLDNDISLFRTGVKYEIERR